MSIPPPQSFELSHSSATYTSADNGTDAERPPSPVANRFEDHSHNVIQALPPVDGGRDAWLFLAAAFMIETLVWGLPFSVVCSNSRYPCSPKPANDFVSGYPSSILVDHQIPAKPVGSRVVAATDTCGHPAGTRSTLLRSAFILKG